MQNALHNYANLKIMAADVFDILLEPEDPSSSVAGPNLRISGVQLGKSDKNLGYTRFLCMVFLPFPRGR